MFRYEEPIFQKKRVLRIEMLEQLRDYPRNYLKLRYQGYSDGIICGCQITWDSGQLEIAPGILYHAGNLYFMEEPCRMECLSKDIMRYLKVQFMTQVREEGKIEGSTRIVLNEQKPDAACEMELCRFRLQEGARLRDTYESFEDYATGYDTVNRIHAPYASYGQATIWPAILKQFAQEILESRGQNVYDISFAMNILANEGEIPAGCVNSYLKRRLGRKETGHGNYSMYMDLQEVLRQEQTGRTEQSGEKAKKRQVILW